jgi:hypothetical protein
MVGNDLEELRAALVARNLRFSLFFHQSFRCIGTVISSGREVQIDMLSACLLFSSEPLPLLGALGNRNRA